MKIKKIINLQTSGAGCGDIKLSFDGLTLCMKYEYSQKGQNLVGGVDFNNVVAYRFFDEKNSKGFIKESYDSVLCVSESEWINELQNDDISHFVVFLSNNGYLEVAAKSACETTSYNGMI